MTASASLPNPDLLPAAGASNRRCLPILLRQLTLGAQVKSVHSRHPCACEVIVDLNARVSAVQAADWLKKAGVCRHLIYFWRGEGKLSPVGKRGRSPLYRLGDVLAVEHATRTSPLGAPRTSSCRSCDRAAERALVAA